VTGDRIDVESDIICDGHDLLAACVSFKHEKERNWKEVRMWPLENDRWKGYFQVEKQGFYEYKVEAWSDHGLNWQHGIERKIADNQKVGVELLEGAQLLRSRKSLAPAAVKKQIDLWAALMEDEHRYDEALKLATSSEVHDFFVQYPDKFLANESQPLKAFVDRSKARFSTWYEFFPRSASQEPGKHGTFKDCHRLLPRIAAMGFDVLYFPPVHPIGEVNRKGKNNTTEAQPGDVGSTWGIGSKHGGHKDIHPELGSLEDFKALVEDAKEQGIDVAMDFALQAAPDHPWVKEHPEWFKWRPDGSVQYAENPPKKYQDILPIFFESDDWKNLWKEMLETALYWVEECGIRVFRVDNPHTKPFYFWGWLIGEVQKKYPDVLFLSEAFTKPKVMHQLAKQGFTQSYTYFTWRNSKHELMEYLNELTTTEQQHFFRPNFWPNTPDINPWALQGGQESVYLQKYFLAATLSSNTGIYGPVFEQMRGEALPGREEYLDSEKFQIRHWDWDIQNKLTTLIGKINQIRKERSSLQQTNNIRFCSIENDQLLAYYKFDQDKQDETLMVVNLDPYYQQNGWVQLPLHELGVGAGHPLRVVDQITGSSYIWDKEWNFVELHPALPFHLFKIEK
jgi:starch synthase (maltosyl-transferring)